MWSGDLGIEPSEQDQIVLLSGPGSVLALAGIQRLVVVQTKKKEKGDLPGEYLGHAFQVLSDLIHGLGFRV